jgi:hypothetical protein
MVGEHDSFFLCESSEQEPDDSLGSWRPPGGGRSRPPLEVHVEEVGALLERAHVAVEVAHVEAHMIARSICARHSRRTSSSLRGPRVLDRAGRPPSPSSRLDDCVIGPHRVRLPLRVQREVHADVLAAPTCGGVARPRARHHQRRGGCHTCPEGVVDPDVRRARRAEIVAVDDQELGVVHSRDARREDTWRKYCPTRPGRPTTPMPAARDVVQAVRRRGRPVLEPEPRGFGRHSLDLGGGRDRPTTPRSLPVWVGTRATSQTDAVTDADDGSAGAGQARAGLSTMRHGTSTSSSPAATRLGPARHGVSVYPNRETSRSPARRTVARRRTAG